MKPQHVLGLSIVLSILIGQLRAQPTIPVITDARAEGDTFRIEFNGSSDPPCVVQGADSLAGPWLDVPLPGQPPGSPVLIMIERARRFFRIRCDTLTSANAAGYLRLEVRGGFSMISNPFDRGGNTVAEVLPLAPAGTLLYKFDAVKQVYSHINQFEFGQWAQPGMTLAPGEGVFFFASSTASQVTFGGTIQPNRPFPALRGQWNIVGAVNELTVFPTPKDGDQIHTFGRDNNGDGIYDAYDAYQASGGTWTPELPDFRLGDAFWYFRNEPNPDADIPGGGTVYFNNRLIVSGFDAPVRDQAGCGLDETYLAQLWAGPDANSLSPVGAPLPFFGGAGAGYIHTIDGGVRRIQGIPPGGSAVVQIRAWFSGSGGTIRTWQDALNAGVPYGMSASLNLGSTGNPALQPPGTPVSLNGFWSSPASSFINLHPAPQTVGVGGMALFRVGTLSPQDVVSYRWQKSVDQTNWTDVAGSNTNELVISPVAPSDAGAYRAVVVTRCNEHISHPATLTIPLVQLKSASMTSSNGIFGFTLLAAGKDLRVEASTNLTNWVAVQTISNAMGPVRFDDVDAPNYGHRFYRATVLDP